MKKFHAARAIPPGETRLHNAGRGLVYRVVKVIGFKRWQYEHRLIVQERIGRPLRRDEHVHHINGDTLDNRSENLALLSNSDHGKITGGEIMKAGIGLFKPIVKRCQKCGWVHPDHAEVLNANA